MASAQELYSEIAVCIEEQLRARCITLPPIRVSRELTSLDILVDEPRLSGARVFVQVPYPGCNGSYPARIGDTLCTFGSLRDMAVTVAKTFEEVYHANIINL